MYNVYILKFFKELNIYFLINYIITSIILLILLEKNKNLFKFKLFVDSI